MSGKVRLFSRDFPSPPAVRGFLHQPDFPTDDALVLTHGAGGNCEAPLLVAVANELAGSGVTVLRCDLPYRQKRPKGSPFPAGAAEDREGLKRALAAVRESANGRIAVGGQSYGGRQATLLLAEDPGLADALLLLSYPLHPPGRPAQLRTAHFPKLQTPALFAHGSRDPFGTLEEIRSALELIPARHELLEIEGGGHGLAGKRPGSNALQAIAARVSASFREFLG